MNTPHHRVLVTAGLPYSNGRPHVGHLAGALLPSDIYARFLRLRGVDVRFVCGSDDYGVAIMLSADKAGKTPAELAAHYNAIQKKDFEGFGLSFDIYSATSQNPHHAKMSQDFFKAVYDKGYLQKETTKQFFDTAKNVFLPDRYVKGTCSFCNTMDQHGDQCENCGKLLDTETLLDPKSVITGAPASVRETAHWFLDLTKFEDTVKSWIDSAELRPQTRGFLSGLLGTGLVRRSMTRDISWGVPVPLDDPDAKDKVLYVWFDAPIGYISNTQELLDNTGSDTLSNWWASDNTDIVHFIGEDNTIFHCVIWIALLAAEGSYKLPKAVVVNQYLNFINDKGEEEKFSKSRGNAIWLGDYLAEGGNPDVLRYYLTAVAPEKSRSAYVGADVIQRNNNDLANTLGNFVNRVLAFTNKYYGPTVPTLDPEKITERDATFSGSFEKVHREVSDLLQGYHFKAALERTMEFCRECNRYIDERAPWTSRKTDDATTKNTLYFCLNAINVLGVLLSPFIPFTSDKMRLALGKSAQATWQEALEPLSPGAEIAEACILFERILAE
jgi:methionyl-tRNA synthetase